MQARMVIGLAAVVVVLYFLARPSASSAPVANQRASVRAQGGSGESRARLQEQIAHEQRARAQVNARLVELEDRLNEIERSEPVVAPAEDNAAPLTADAVSEADVATWMDEHLNGRVDRAATQQASLQIQDSLELVGLTDLRVENVGCAERFCRASFSQESGERPAVSELFGAAPFTGEGFTIEEPDGRIAIYFGRNGASVRDFRSEALAAAAP